MKHLKVNLVRLPVSTGKVGYEYSDIKFEDTEEVVAILQVERLVGQETLATVNYAVFSLVESK